MQDSSNQFGRRDAMKALAAGAAVVSAAPAAVAKSPSDRMLVGVIGLGGRGREHARQLAQREDVQVAYVCDADRKRAEQSGMEVEKASGKRPQVVQDLREVLDDRDVNAVVIATPDHWHAPATILACKAGKHVYVEKPCSHNVREGRMMVNAAREHDRVVQVGTQARNSIPHAPRHETHSRGSDR